MNKSNQRFSLGLLALGCLAWSSLTHAKSGFPSEIEKKYGLTYQPPCSVCHIKGNVGSATPITLFALSLRARGLTGDNQSLESSLSKLEADGVDSDGDTVADIEELKAGTDPNSPVNASIADGQEPGYGCGGTAPHGRSVPGMAGVLSLAWLVLRRRRGHS